MRYITLIALLISVVSASCNKPLPDYSAQPFVYTIAGDTDISVPSNDAGYFFSTLTLASGNAAMQPVTVSFKGIPPNVTLQEDSFSFRLNYSFGDLFTARNAAQGVYPMQVIYNSSTGTKTINFNLTIAPPLNRVAIISGGTYTPSNTCGPYIYISCTIDSVAGLPGEIMLIDYIAVTNLTSTASYDTTYAFVDCCSNTFVIPSQKVRGATITGTGSFAQGNINISKTIATDTSTISCNYTLSNQP